MTLGMKRGFLGNKKSPKAARVAEAPKATPADGASEGTDDFRLSDTCRAYSDNPRIVIADYRHGNAPEASHFLYMPPQNSTIVLLDHLQNILPISRWDLWKKHIPWTPPNPPYALEQSTDKGMKMVACRPIQQGELIALERPLVVSRTDIAIAEDQRSSGIFYQAALSGLSSAARASIVSLHNAFGPEQDPILGTLLTNQHPVTIPESPQTEYSGLFPTLCRANHDCSPNTNFFFNPRTFTGQFHAVRAIEKDEEITALYCELAASREERRAELSEHYKFLCECKTCALPSALVEQSDARRRAIADLIPLMHQGTYSDDMSVARIEELLEWATHEGLYALYAELLIYGYGLAIKLGAPAFAQKWSQLAAVAFRVLDGADSPRFG